MNRELRGTAEVRASVDEVRELLACEPRAVLNGRNRPRGRSIEADLRIDLHGGAAATQRVVLEIGPGETDGDTTWFPVSWRPASRNRILPAFDGKLSVTPAGWGSVIHVAGRYVAPLGKMGALVDRAVMRRLAVASVDAFVAELAGRIDEEVDARTISSFAPPAADDFRPRSFEPRAH